MISCTAQTQIRYFNTTIRNIEKKWLSFIVVYFQQSHKLLEDQFSERLLGYLCKFCCKCHHFIPKENVEKNEAGFTNDNDDGAPSFCEVHNKNPFWKVLVYYTVWIRIPGWIGTRNQQTKARERFRCFILKKCKHYIGFTIHTICQSLI
jgi:hypothetical protein